ncbi:2-isopropylmalate synthase [Candidatus Micrarchaeota archaeon CG1_02_49_24]|nr:MAG: 2-isopropylmalate synthase [Candidatus Micrarchaeota archaeon CG1_02_49_24]HII53709.1 2-isopropylmalate synthase [Candidatus Micrarchaeota archaeon]
MALKELEGKIYVSDYNESVNKSLSLPQKVRIFDTSLRDGEQLPGVTYRGEDKIEIARALDKLGVDIIEAGFPVNSEGELATAKKISSLGLKSKVCGLARAITNDIDACIQADVEIVHTFISTSDIHLKYQMNKTREQVYEEAVTAVEYSKSHGFKTLFSAMDASRTEPNYLIKVFNGAVGAGADIINVPDTVGVMHPPAMRELIKRIRNEVKVPIDVHCHNDFGLAVANSLAAVEAGADGVQVSMNGLGERAGNASLEQIVMSLHCLYGVRTGVKTERLYETSKLIERLSEVTLPPFQPIVGSTAFAHESGIHAHAVLKHASTFEPMLPELVGQKRNIVIGKDSGKASIEVALRQLGFEVGDAKLLMRIVERIKEVSLAKKRIYNEDIRAIASDVLGKGKRKALVELDEFVVTTGNKIKPSATLKIKFKGDTVESKGIGVGPVDATAKALEAAFPKRKLKLVEYNLRAITGGTDALADVEVKVEVNGKPYIGHAVDGDIVMASVNAMVRALDESLAMQSKE